MPPTTQEQQEQQQRQSFLRPLLFFAQLPTLNFLTTCIQNHASYDVAIVIPFSTESRRATFKHVEAIVRCVYSAVTEDATLVLIGNDEDKTGGVVLPLEDLKSAITHIKSDVIIVGDKNTMRTQNWPGWNVRYTLLENDDVAGRGSSSMTQASAYCEHDYTCVGGTFDYLHAGHKLLLTMTLYLLSPSASTPTMINGLTGEALLGNKTYRQHLTSWSTRCDSVVEFLAKILLCSVPQPTIVKSSDLATTDRLQKYILGSDGNISTRPETENKSNEILLEMHEIQDAFGPTITMQEVTSLTVSEETISGGAMINDKRREKGWGELEVFTVGLIESNEGDGKLSSTKIRERMSLGTKTSTL